jgi:2-C-methyl-D-erythritol 2,4-cyclodiphosphate synthase
MRIGFGYDSHRFKEGRPLILGGVEIPDHAGLEGHSDGDAICHAVLDALLGAAAAGSIGQLFPSSDDRWKNANSVELLRRGVGYLRNRHWQIVNVDVTVICETPRIGPVSLAMREKIGRVLGIGASGVSIKGKTDDGMGWTGSGEGLAVHAVALIQTLEEQHKVGEKRESSFLEGRSDS